MTIYTDLYLLRAANALALTICHLAEAAETNEAAQMLLDESLELQKQLANLRDEVEGI